MVIGIVYVFMEFVVCDWSNAQLNLQGAHWGIDNYRPSNYLSDFDENWLKGVYMCQDDTCGIISQSDRSFKTHDQKSKCFIYVIIE